MEKQMYQEAIADAKAVRASALANAKAVIQEAFEPKLKEMIKKTIEETESMEEEEMVMPEEGAEMGGEYNEAHADQVDEDTLEEMTLDQILAELEGEEDAPEKEDEGMNLYEAEEEEEEEETEEEGEGEEEEGEETEEEKSEVLEMTPEEFTQLVKDAVAAAMAEKGGVEDMAGGEEEMDMMGSDSEKIDLEEILAELGSETEGMYEAKAKKTEKKVKEELEEAKKAIKIMQQELNETNLLNAKLLYVNKIFKAKTLSESQKVKVLNSFDKATTVRETQTVYNTLMESLQTTKKTSITESIGFASKAAGNAPSKNTVESDPFVARMQRLAGIL